MEGSVVDLARRAIVILEVDLEAVSGGASLGPGVEAAVRAQTPGWEALCLPLLPAVCRALTVPGALPLLSRLVRFDEAAPPPPMIPVVALTAPQPQPAPSHIAASASSGSLAPLASFVVHGSSSGSGSGSNPAAVTVGITLVTPAAATATADVVPANAFPLRFALGSSTSSSFTGVASPSPSPSPSPAASLTPHHHQATHNVSSAVAVPITGAAGAGAGAGASTVRAPNSESSRVRRIGARGDAATESATCPTLSLRAPGAGEGESLVLGGGPDSATDLATAITHAQSRHVVQVLDEIIKTRPAELFRAAVTEEDAPGYAAFTREPMDLGTLRDLVSVGHVTTFIDLRRLLSLIVSNCKAYNEGEVSQFRALEWASDRPTVRSDREAARERYKTLTLPPPPPCRTTKRGQIFSTLK